MTLKDNRAVGFGDSIMLSAKTELDTYLIAIRAEEGRQFAEGVDVIERLLPQLPKNVVVHLGTNGPIADADIARMSDMLRPHRVGMLSLYAKRAWIARNNRLIKEFCAEQSHLSLVKWRSLAKQNPDWFADGVHPNAQGQAAYAALVSDWVRRG